MFFASCILIHLAGQTPAYSPADPKATPEVKTLLSYLKSVQGKGFVSGQTDYKDTEWIKAHTGKLPAILGLDFMHAPRWMGHQTDTGLAIDWTKNRNGIVTFQWHWSSPGAKNPGSGFYSKDNPFDISTALSDPNSSVYKALIADIDDVAGEIRKLNEARVPIIFRPLHEAQGAWFWWGAKGADPCKKLYNILFDRITRHHNLHNIAWAWTAYPASNKKGDPAAWYPGDDRVDIVVSDYCESGQDYADLVALTGGRKMVALAETMNAPDPDKSLGTTPWAYWVTWARRDWNKNSDLDMKRAMTRSQTITLDMLPKH